LATIFFGRLSALAQPKTCRRRHQVRQAARPKNADGAKAEQFPRLGKPHNLLIGRLRGAHRQVVRDRRFKLCGGCVDAPMKRW
jgi:hypothetical protein